MKFTDMELAIIERALRNQATILGFDAVAFTKGGDYDASQTALRHAQQSRDLADKVANRFNQE